MLNWKKLCTLPGEELERVDIVVKNLACAVGVPGAERFDFEKCVWKVDEFAFDAGNGQPVGTAFVVDAKIEDHCEETVRSICQTLRRANEFAKDSK